ncbi:MAG: pyridoxamine 5'-phosphate oxidase [Planctomycetes bacterium]|nr:pyridoxamine 5'-phosphate oxidase [Planctomycetota bacterium]
MLSPSSLTDLSAAMPVLDERTAEPTPFPLFRRWYEDAIRANLPEPGAMSLATASAAGAPSARMVLLRGYDESGFVFFTNYTGRKATDLAVNPRAALVLFWSPLHRQIRIEGAVAKVTEQESDDYFRSRPFGHRLGALASPQSQVIPGRAVLEDRMAELEREFAGKEVPRPATWGGYRVTPLMIEFWQGRESRLHDRLRYQVQANGSWLLERLAP